ncbi:MAG TPA: LON peptidase substrate-binding domain-containing protein [Thermoanaerobaculia bacterium]|jgi:Lon protease-like protein|nr:LON peptidase substrate-binding domain-containing protein [Thermoanaerobaculia bacterium]
MPPLPEGEFLLPLFPLPNIVFFPHTRLPLHVFEPRYRQMVQDALESEERFGIVLLRPGWEADYFGAPPVYGCGTVGTIEQAVPLEDGRYNIVVRGDVRFRILDEVSRVPYRTARVIVEHDAGAHIEEMYAQREWLADISRQYLQYLPDQTSVPEIETVSLDALTNALIMSLNLDMEEKQRLLELRDVIARAEQIGNELTSRMESLRFLAPFRRTSDPTHN